MSDVYEVEAIIKHRKNRDTNKDEYLVSWKNYEEPTWEPAENLTNCKRKLRAFHLSVRFIFKL